MKQITKIEKLIIFYNHLKALKQELYRSTNYIHCWLRKQPEVKEESITDWLLFNLSEHLPNVFYHAFDRHEEGKNGADWEWWFLFPNCYYIRFRVQAKKLSIKNNYRGIGYKSGLQIQKLLESSKQANAVPVYALYTSVTGDSRCEDTKITKNEGVFIAGAQEIYDLFIQSSYSSSHPSSPRKVSNTDLLELSIPLSCLVFCPLATVDRGALEQYLHNFFQLDGGSWLPDLENSKGLHDQLPNYLSNFLEKKQKQIELSDGWESYFNGWEQDFQSKLQDFNALLIYDFRSYGDHFV